MWLNKRENKKINNYSSFSFLSFKIGVCDMWKGNSHSYILLLSLLFSLSFKIGMWYSFQYMWLKENECWNILSCNFFYRVISREPILPFINSLRPIIGIARTNVAKVVKQIDKRINVKIYTRLTNQNHCFVSSSSICMVTQWIFITHNIGHGRDKIHEHIW